MPEDALAAEGKEYHPGKAEIVSREAEVLDLLARGDRPDAICQKLSEKWGACDRTVRRYLTRAYKSLAGAGRVKAEEELGRALIRFDYLYGKAIETSDFRLGLAVTKERGEIMGLYDAKSEQAGGKPGYFEYLAEQGKKVSEELKNMTKAEKIKRARDQAAKLNKLADIMEAEGEDGEKAPALGQPGAANLAS